MSTDQIADVLIRHYPLYGPLGTVCGACPDLTWSPLHQTQMIEKAQAAEVHALNELLGELRTLGKSWQDRGTAATSTALRELKSVIDRYSS